MFRVCFSRAHTSNGRMKLRCFVFLTVQLSFVVAESGGPNITRSYEYKIKKHILQNYDTMTRPVQNDSGVIKVDLSMSLYHILDTNEKFQTLSALLSIRMKWRDAYLTWNEADFGNSSKIWIPSRKIWTPDIVVSNSAHEKIIEYMNTNCIIQSDGSIMWMIPVVTKTYCQLNIRHFPFDSQKCQLKFFSWTYSGLQLDLTHASTNTNMVYYKAENQEWQVDKITVKRNNVTYVCCEEPYPDITFTIHMRRQSLFYVFHLMFPCCLIYLVSFLGFFLPVESGEKINLEITILLALVVFLLIVSETLPPTPKPIPILGLLFGMTMIMVTIALIMAVIVTNIYIRKNSDKRVPYWIRKLMSEGLTSKNKRSGSHTVRRQNSAVFRMRQKRNSNQDTELCGEESEKNGKKNNGIQSPNGQTMRETLIPHLSVDISVDEAHCEGASLNGDAFGRKSAYGPQYDHIEDTDWIRLSQKLDFYFFVIFLIASIFAFIALFSQVPSFDH